MPVSQFSAKIVSENGVIKISHALNAAKNSKGCLLAASGVTSWQPCCSSASQVYVVPLSSTTRIFSLIWSVTWKGSNLSATCATTRWSTRQRRNWRRCTGDKAALDSRQITRSANSAKLSWYPATIAVWSIWRIRLRRCKQELVRRSKVLRNWTLTKTGRQVYWIGGRWKSATLSSLN